MRKPGLFRLVSLTSALPLGNRPRCRLAARLVVRRVGGSGRIRTDISRCVYGLFERTKVDPSEGVEPSCLPAAGALDCFARSLVMLPGLVCKSGRVESCSVRVRKPLRLLVNSEVPSNWLRAEDALRRGAGRRSGQHGWIRTNMFLRVGPLRVDEVAPAEGIEPPNHRLTAGCLTIRLRWNIGSWRRRAVWPKPHPALARRAFDAKFS